MKENLNESIKSAQLKAQYLIGTSNLDDVFPLNVEQLATELGIDLQYGQFSQNISGVLKRKNKEGCPVIIINSADSPVRQRFTIAHELGHYLLHSQKLLHVDSNFETVYFRDENSSRANKIEEIQANAFAAELLMPSKDLEDQFKKLSTQNLENIVIILAKRYQVSTTAMAIKVNKVLENI